MRKVFYHGKEIQYTLTRKEVKNINLRIKPDGQIMVSANKKVPLKYIDDFVVSKGKWINSKLSQFKNKRHKISIIKYVDGEKIKYLGKDIELVFLKRNHKNTILCDNKLYIYLENNEDKYERKEMVINWYRDRALMVFNNSIEKMYPVIKNYGVKKPIIKIKSMKSRWGSCIKYKNTITLNVKLIKMPLSTIDYVVVHELAHFIYSGHNNDFYSLLSKLMPAWKTEHEYLKTVTEGTEQF